MHKRRRDPLIAYVQSLMNGSVVSVTSIGHGVRGKLFEKHRIKRADRL